MILNNKIIYLIYGIIISTIGITFYTIDAIYHPTYITAAKDKHVENTPNTSSVDPDKLINLQQVSLSNTKPLLHVKNKIDLQSPPINITYPVMENVVKQIHIKLEQEKTIQHIKDLKRKQELHCLALNNYFEARGESTIGQRAVANVVLNRVNHPGFPDTICAVVKQGGYKRKYRCQFSWWCDGISDRPLNQRSWRQSVTLAREVLENKRKDNTLGALWYHAHYVSPYWRTSMKQGPKIGKHIFYSARKAPNRKVRRAT